MESVNGLTGTVVMIVILLVLLFTIGAILTKLYRRASKETSFVRTGFGGQRVIMNGGALVFPVLHEIIPVNMNTLRLEVRRANEAALITRDRMRVDVTAEFYVRAKPNEEAIANAAQTLGKRTMHPQALKELVEGKFVDALRAVAAEMAMEELHEQRVEFVQKVQKAVTEDLLKNGLELETVSLTSLDQTNREFFNPQNAFDAQGLTKLTEEIEERRKQRNDIEQDTEVKVQNKNLEAEQMTLQITREKEYARLAQAREVEVRKAEEIAMIAKMQAENQRLSEEAKITEKQKVDQARIIAERAVEEERIQKEQILKERDIGRTQAVEISDQVREIAIAEKSKERSVAQAEAEQARAKMVKAAEEVVTVQEQERAERQKIIELVEAAKMAEKQAIGVTVAAEAEKQASEDRAEALRIFAQGESEKARIRAEGESQAEILKAEAAQKRYEVDAAGQRALHEAENTLSKEIVEMKVKLAVVERLQGIIRESVKPMEQIEGIKIYQVEGLNGSNGGHGGNGEGGNGQGNLADQLVNSALRYRSQAPLLDSLMKDIGLNPGDINGLTEMLHAEAKGGPATGESSPAENPQKK